MYLYSLIHALASLTIRHATSQHINSADPKAPPVIDPQYLEQDIDLELLVEAVRFVRQVADTEPFKGLVAEEVVPGRQAVRSESDEELTGKHSTLHVLCEN